jgi:hypothetical protein
MRICPGEPIPSIDGRSWLVTRLDVEPRFDRLPGRPEFRALVRRVGLV